MRCFWGYMGYTPRSKQQLIKDFITFPIRAFHIFEDDKWGLTSLASERFDYVKHEVQGYCLDVGCGRYNRFINKYLEGHGIGIDVFKYEGLTEENLVEDIKKFPFPNETFDTVTFIANINHIPPSMRDNELSEAYRCLKYGGNVLVTIANPVAGIAVHKVVRFHDIVFGTNYDMDHARGMAEGEEYYLKDKEIVSRLAKAGFINIRRKYFWTQWFLNHMFIGYK